MLYIEPLPTTAHNNEEEEELARAIALSLEKEAITKKRQGKKRVNAATHDPKQNYSDKAAQQGLLIKPANTTGDIARFILLFQGDQGFQWPNGQDKGHTEESSNSDEEDSGELLALT